MTIFFPFMILLRSEVGLHPVAITLFGMFNDQHVEVGLANDTYKMFDYLLCTSTKVDTL